MKKKEYRIHIHSIFRFIFAFVVLLCSGIFLILDNIPKPDSEIISIVQFLVVFIFSFYLSHWIGTGKAKIVFEHDGVHHIWERRFFLSWEKNHFIPWNLVDNYVFQEDRTFDSFIINLTNKTRYKVNRMNVLSMKDDFKQLVKDFPKLSNQYKSGLDADIKTKTIKEGETIYQSKSFRWFFYFLMLGFLFLVILKVLTPNSETSWGPLMIIGSAVAFYGIMNRNHKRSK